MSQSSSDCAQAKPWLRAKTDSPLRINRKDERDPVPVSIQSGSHPHLATKPDQENLKERLRLKEGPLAIFSGVRDFYPFPDWTNTYGRLNRRNFYSFLFKQSHHDPFSRDNLISTIYVLAATGGTPFFRNGFTGAY